MSTHRGPERLVKVALDLVVLSGAYCLAFFIRFEGAPSPGDVQIMTFSLAYTVFVQLGCLAALRVPKSSWRYISLREAERILTGLALATALLVLWRLTSQLLSNLISPTPVGRVPFSVLVIDLLLSFFGTLGMRVTTRAWMQRSKHKEGAIRKAQVPSVLIGAGSAGALVAKEIVARPEFGIDLVGFVDDDPAKLGMIIHGVRVLGTTQDLEQIARNYGVKEALITINDLPASNTRRLVNLCAESGISAKLIPGIRDMVQGRVNLSTIRDVAIADLLHREPVKLDGLAVARVVGSRRIAITGAGGSIGSELCREVSLFRPAALLLVEQAENNLFQVHRRLSQMFPKIDILPYIADICDYPRMDGLFSYWRPDAVFHAAAHKHVPMMESNPGEAIKNNIIGTKNLADLADCYGIKDFVMISTDKAVNPTSIMGVSKRIAEIYIQSLAQRSKTRFVTVRFGNVLGSAGSVIPIFKEQIARGGPITVTHPDMKRYFMTIPEACQLVLQAASMHQGGEIYILDMGEPVKILELAQDLIRLSGLSTQDIEIRFVGIRPGEKLFEELSFEEENVQKTRHAKIFVARTQPHDWKTINDQIDELRKLCDCPDTVRVFAKLQEIVPEFKPQHSPSPGRPHFPPGRIRSAPEPVRNGSSRAGGLDTVAAADVKQSGE